MTPSKGERKHPAPKSENAEKRPIDSEQIEGYLKKMELKYFKSPEGEGRFLVRFKKSGDLDVVLSVDPLLLWFGLRGFESRSADTSVAEKMPRKLLERNFQTIVGKYGVSKDGDLVLEQAIPLAHSSLSFYQFQATLQSLILEAACFQRWIRDPDLVWPALSEVAKEVFE